MKLNESLLKRICNYSAANSAFMKEPKQVIDRYNDIWFKDILAAQPELARDVQLFYDVILPMERSRMFPQDEFTNIFKDKIEPTVIVKQIANFGTLCCRLNISEKIALMNDIVTHDPSFTKAYHDYMKGNLKNYHVQDDNYLCYIALVKKDKGKSNLPKDEVMEIVRNFKPYKMAPIKRFTSFINSYLGTTSEAADLIYDTVKKYIATDSAMKKLWEEKISTFPSEIQAKYEETKRFEPFKSKKSYFLSYSIDPNWITDEFDYSSNKANLTKSMIYMMLEDIIKTNTNKTVSTYTRNAAVLEIHTQTLEDRDKCEKLVNIVFDALPSELNKHKDTGIDYTAKDQVTETLNKAITSYLMAEDLQKNLIQKTEHKPKGMKI